MSTKSTKPKLKEQEEKNKAEMIAKNSELQKASQEIHALKIQM